MRVQELPRGYLPEYQAQYFPPLVGSVGHSTYPQAPRRTSRRATPPQAAPTSNAPAAMHPFTRLLRHPPSRSGAASALEGGTARTARHHSSGPPVLTTQRSRSDLGSYIPTTRDNKLAARQARVKGRLDALQVQVEHAAVERQNKFRAKLDNKVKMEHSYLSKIQKKGEGQLKALVDRGRRHYAPRHDSHSFAAPRNGAVRREQESLCQPIFQSGGHMNESMQMTIGRSN